ncbi:hypothetical protein U1Q18_034942 [Sarracenia purpurea var. burkii]
MGQQGEAAHSDDWRPSSPANKSSIFYRMIVSSIIQDKKLRIPGKFVKKLWHELPAVATLTTPNGCVWEVGLKKIYNKVWFTDGWQEFVKHQSIRVGYLLFFTYLGNSNFNVNIYDLGAAEIKYRCNTDTGICCPVLLYKEEVEDDDSVEILDSSPPFPKPISLENKVFDETVDRQKLGKSCDSPLLQNLVRSCFGPDLGNDKHDTRKSPSPSKGLKLEHRFCMDRNNPKLEDEKGVNKFQAELNKTGILSISAQSTRDVGIQCGFIEFLNSTYETRLHYLSQRPEILRKRKRGIGHECQQLLAKHGSKLHVPGTETSCGTFSRRWRVTKPEEKERALNASKTFESENPFCRVILRRSYIYKGIGLHMPASFAEKYLNGVSGFIVLEVPNGEKWPVRCMWRDGSAKLSKGWPDFVRDNRLEEGDVCVFELIKADEVVLKVTIFHLAEDEDPVNQLPKDHLLNS